MNYISDFGLALALLSLIGLGASGLGYRWGLWSYRIGISIVKCAGFTSVVAVVACLIGVVLWNRNIVTEGMTPAMVQMRPSSVSPILPPSSLVPPPGG